MSVLFQLRIFVFVLIVSSMSSLRAHCQVTYFYQDFGKTTSLVNPQPDTSQFSHIILTAPALSYHKFHKGFMELTRTRQDSATGGIIRVLRATPFTPSPQNLYIQITLSAEAITAAASNALYFYLGENFDPVNNSFPGNNLMFAKYAVSLTEKGLIFKDLGSQRTSDTIALKEKVTVTWVLNNDNADLEYVSPKGKRMVEPGSYDLWVGEKALCLGYAAYPEGSSYSRSKLSNFEMRFRNGLGKIRIHDMLIKSIGQVSEVPETVVAPNPVISSSFLLNALGIRSESVRLFSVSGKMMPVNVALVGPEIRVTTFDPLPAGIYIVRYTDVAGQLHSSRILAR